MNSDETISAIQEHEQRRCAALVAGHRAALLVLIAKDLIHIHATGRIDNYESYVSFLDRVEFLTVDRKHCEVRAYGDVAVATGLLHQIVRVKQTSQIHDLNVTTTQVWRKQAEGWQQTIFHATSAFAG